LLDFPRKLIFIEFVILVELLLIYGGTKFACKMEKKGSKGVKDDLGQEKRRDWLGYWVKFN
jgi:hypothetical protein